MVVHVSQHVWQLHSFLRHAHATPDALVAGPRAVWGGSGATPQLDAFYAPAVAFIAARAYGRAPTPG